MIKQYNVTKATPAGEAWKTQYGSMMQTFFLELEGVAGKWASVNRRADSPILSGPTWFEVEETTSKSGKPGLKLKVTQAPDGAPSHAQASLPLEDAPMRWGEAVTAAANLASNVGWAQKIAAEEGITGFMRLAKDIYTMNVPDRQALKKAEEAEKELFHTDPKSGDKVIDEVPQGEIDFEDIPF